MSAYLGPEAIEAILESVLKYQRGFDEVVEDLARTRRAIEFMTDDEPRAQLRVKRQGAVEAMCEYFRMACDGPVQSCF